MLSTLFKNVNALSMFVIITVLGISIYTILTYKSLLLFEKDIYRIKAQISSLSIALQNQMQKECAHVEHEKQQHQKQQNSFDGQEHVMQTEGAKEQMTHEKPSNMVNTADAQGNTQKDEQKKVKEEEEEEEEDDDVSAAEIAKLKKLVANIESDDENSHDESEDGEISLCLENEPLEMNDMVQNTEKKEDTKEKDMQDMQDMQDDQELSIESFIQGHPVGQEESASVPSVPILTAEQLHKMRYEELRQYLRLQFGVSQSRGTKADLIAKINQQQDVQK